jgi:hypothetical protein
MIDTEADRGLVYADEFKFRHITFREPFSPLDYLEAIEFAEAKGVRTLIIDSMSHEHEGPGGVLEWHDREVERMGGAKNEFPAWAKPKAARRRMVQRMLQLKLNVIACFRAQPKIALLDDPERPGKKKPTDIGWVAITDSKLLFEFPLRCLLLGNADGRPTWISELEGEQNMIRRPGYFRHLFGEKTQLSEDIGQALAQWAVGGKAEVKREPHPMDDKTAEIIARYEAAQSAESALEATDLVVANKKSFAPYQLERLSMAKRAAEARLGVNQGASAGNARELTRSLSRPTRRSR